MLDDVCLAYAANAHSEQQLSKMVNAMNSSDAVMAEGLSYGPEWLSASEGNSLSREQAEQPHLLRTLVVVPALNEEQHIEQTLRSLLKELERLPRAVIAVVDGGSRDGTCAIVESLHSEDHRVVLLHNPKRIQSAATNLAVRAFGQNAQVMIRCDAHSVYPRDFCLSLLTTLVRVDADAVVVPMVSAGTTRLQRLVAWTSNSRIGTGGSAHRGQRARSEFVDHGHHAAIRMDMFRSVGGYDETFSHNEDAEFDCRQRAVGGRIYLDAQNPIHYFPRSTFRALWRQYYNYGAGRSRTARRHPRSLRMRQLAVVANGIGLVLAFLLAPKFPVTLLLPLLYTSALLAGATRVALGNRDWLGLLAVPVASVMHIAWAAGFLVEFFRTQETAWTVAEAKPLWGTLKLRAPALGSAVGRSERLDSRADAATMQGTDGTSIEVGA
ncbi:MAG: succinoglycan biosynthesis protein ExoA [Myxococcaceae bacterium]|nr:succinoglycan biosynthesis protein ExoA [Myxococcaceae bacterium]